MAKIQGGLIVPERIRVKKGGLMAWIYRLLGSEKGWKYINPMRDIWKKIGKRDLRDKVIDLS